MSNTRFTFSDVLTVTEPAVQLAGQSVRNYSDEQLKQIAATLYAQNEAHKTLFGENMQNGCKPVPDVIDIIRKEIARREDAALDAEIEAAERVVEANKTQEMRLTEAKATLDAALAKKAARKA